MMGQQLWEVCKQVIHSREGGGPKALALRLGIDLVTVYRYGMPAAPDGSGVSIPGDRIIPLSLAAKDEGIIRHLANELGLHVVRVAMPKHRRLLSVTKEMIKTISNFSMLTNDSSQALRDGRISRTEYARIAKDADAAIEQILAYKKTLEKHIDVDLNDEGVGVEEERHA